MLTQGVYRLDDLQLAALMKAVADFNEFTEDNDPYGEHDFGKILFDGVDYFWKIEDHGGTGGYHLVMTIMRADEY